MARETHADLPAAALPLILPYLVGDLFFVAATSAVSRDWRIAATAELAQCRKLIVPESLAPAFTDEKLKQALKRMSPLGPSILDLSGCCKLTDMSMRQVVLALREVPYEICLRNCCTISWRGLKLLCRMLMALHRGELWKRRKSQIGNNSNAKSLDNESKVSDNIPDLWRKILAEEELPPGPRPYWFDQLIGWSSTKPQQPSIARDAAFAFSNDQPPTITKLPDGAGLGAGEQ